MVEHNLNLLNNDSILKSVDIDDKYQQELYKKTMDRNIDREVMLSVFMIVIIIFMLTIGIVNNAIYKLGLKGFIQFLVPHIFLFIVPCAFLILNYINKKIKPVNLKWQRAAHLIINISVLIMCAIIGSSDGIIGKNTYIYSIAMFYISTIVLLKPKERLIIFSLPCLTYIIIIGENQLNLINQLDSIFYMIILSIIAYFCSNINYNSYVKNFNNNKIILEKNKELNSMYNISQENLIEKTAALKKAEEYEKLRTNFFANISHELRTPLTIIFSGQQMLDVILRKADIGKVKADVYKYMDIINQNCNRLLRLISNLIDITKIDAGYFNVYLSNCDIIKIVEDITLSVVKYIEDRDVGLVFDTEIEEKVIACDPEKIERVMLNLLSNAVKFTPPGGNIYVDIRLIHNNVVISVKDTGIGIPPGMKTLIFERFVQVDKTTTRSNEGSGIGLCIVKSLIELHNGRIYVNSEEGVGSEFVIELPDKTVEHEEKPCGKIKAEENSRIQRINIEFSDIYD